MERYEVGKVLGKGKFSVVKLACNVVTGDKVAIKIFDKEQLLKGRSGRIKSLVKKKVCQLPLLLLYAIILLTKCSVPLHLDLNFGYLLIQWIKVNDRDILFFGLFCLFNLFPVQTFMFCSLEKMNLRESVKIDLCGKDGFERNCENEFGWM